MKALLIHAKEFYYRPTEKVKALKSIEEEGEVLRESKFSNVLVAFVSVEKEDEEIGKERAVEEGVRCILDGVNWVKVKSVVLYPYAHLSTSLSSPKFALEVLKGISERLRELNLEVCRAPFGWYKEMLIHTAGHPLSEKLRTADYTRMCEVGEHVKHTGAY